MITPTAEEPKEREWIGPKADPIECKKMISLCLTHIDATNTCGEQDREIRLYPIGLSLVL